MEDLRRISNSEVQTWLACKFRYRQQFDLKLERIHQSGALNKGNMVHKALELAYDYLKNATNSSPISIQYAQSKGEAYLSSLLSTDQYAMEDVTEAYRLYVEYCNRWLEIDANEWEILGVEEELDLPINDKFTMPFRYDLRIRERSTGKIGLVDHKTCYDFWSDEDLSLNPQFPKYLGAMRANGLVVDFCMLNQIRTRKITATGADGDAKKWRRSVVTPHLANIKNVLYQHIMAGEEIVEFRSLPEIARERVAIPCLNKVVCKYCDFKDICITTLQGGDPTNIILTEYQANSYDYNKIPDVMDSL